MIVGVPRETYPGERRVALVPIVIPNLAKAGLEFIVEAGAGAAAGFPDAEYAAKGAKIVADRAQLFAAVTRFVPVAMTRPSFTTIAPNGPPRPERTFSTARSIASCMYDSFIPRCAPSAHTLQIVPEKPIPPFTVL